MIDRIEGDYYIGRTEFDSPEVDPEVLINREGCELKIGEFCKVKVTDSDNFDLFAVVVD
jgi:ribosomal protein S12 methylthiotransferase